MSDSGTLQVRPIGVIRSPYTERVGTPRQPSHQAGEQGIIELHPGHHFDHALLDLDRWQYIWVLYWFHLNAGWKPRVLPPRSSRKRGVFATRSPHRPNPIGLSVYRLLRVDGLSLHVAGVDALDGTPVLDIKPYLPYADALPNAGNGWLDDEAAVAAAEPRHDVVERHLDYSVSYTELARRQLQFLDERGVNLLSQIEAVLKLGPAPHPYRRIKRSPRGLILAVKDWRVLFRVDALAITIEEVCSGYNPKQLATTEALPVARAFVETFGHRRLS